MAISPNIIDNEAKKFLDVNDPEGPAVRVKIHNSADDALIAQELNRLLGATTIDEVRVTYDYDTACKSYTYLLNTIAVKRYDQCFTTTGWTLIEFSLADTPFNFEDGSGFNFEDGNAFNYEG